VAGTSVEGWYEKREWGVKTRLPEQLVSVVEAVVAAPVPAAVPILAAEPLLSAVPTLAAARVAVAALAARVNGVPRLGMGHRVPHYPQVAFLASSSMLCLLMLA